VCSMIRSFVRAPLRMAFRIPLDFRPFGLFCSVSQNTPAAVRKLLMGLDFMRTTHRSRPLRGVEGINLPNPGRQNKEVKEDFCCWGTHLDRKFARSHSARVEHEERKAVHLSWVSWHDASWRRVCCQRVALSLGGRQADRAAESGFRTRYSAAAQG